MTATKTVRGDMKINKLVLTREEIDDEYRRLNIKWASSSVQPAGRDYDKAISRATVKKVFRELPWKRTVIGNERSMPDKTVIWFITGEEYEALKATEGK